MKLSYDPKTDSLYIHLSNRTSVNSEEVAEGIVLDFAEDGTLVGIDVQHAKYKADLENLSIFRVPFQMMEAA